MKVKVFSVYDSKAGSFKTPFFQATLGLAVRAWETVVNDETTEFHKYPSDFTLFELGEYDAEKGVFENLQAKTNLGLATEFKKHSLKAVGES